VGSSNGLLAYEHARAIYRPGHDGFLVNPLVVVMTALGMIATLVNAVVWKSTQRWLIVFSWLALVLSLIPF
jgi:fumarate reductase subunit C